MGRGALRPEIAVGREIARGDRVIGIAASQAGAVHQGVGYDIEGNTGQTESGDCARTIAARGRTFPGHVRRPDAPIAPVACRPRVRHRCNRDAYPIL